MLPALVGLCIYKSSFKYFTLDQMIMCIGEQLQ